MSSKNLIRLGGFAAIVAGILRGVNSFLASSNPNVTISILYLLTDIFLLFGIIGIYSFQHQESRSWGLFGFLLAIVGIAIIRTGSISGANLYPIGASIFTAGMSLFAVGSWIASSLPRWISILWLLATIVGFMGYFIPGLNLLKELEIRVWSERFVLASARIFLSGTYLGTAFAGNYRYMRIWRRGASGWQIASGSVTAML